jgi:glycosyltransferase involved in cell wall biosynthesis
MPRTLHIAPAVGAVAQLWYIRPATAQIVSQERAMPGISSIVITFNEEQNIRRCLESVAPFSDEIIVVDSLSTDRTVEIAREYATRVVEHEWLGYGRQKQLALDQARGEWVFSIDADEVVSPELAEEIGSLAPDCDGYEVPRLVWYLGRWIRHSGWYPGYVLRLFRRQAARFSEDAVHESVQLAGPRRRLRGDLLHYSYRDVAHHVAKINDFTSLAARQMDERGRRAGLVSLALTPGMEFLKVYLLRRGFLDGYPGLVVSTLHAWYVFLKYAKLRERQHAPAREDAAVAATRGAGLP